MTGYFKNMLFASVLSAGLLSIASMSVAGEVPKHTGGSITNDLYSDNLLEIFGAIPVIDWESAALNAKEEPFYQLKEDNEFDKIKNRISDKKFLKAKYEYYDDSVMNDETLTGDDGDYYRFIAKNPNTTQTYFDFAKTKGDDALVKVEDDAEDYYHPYSRLEELRQVALSYKPVPKVFDGMLYDGIHKGKGTTIYPGNKDNNRVEGAADNDNATGDTVNPGIKQILYYNRDGYQYDNTGTPALNAMPISVFDLHMMDGLTKQHEDAGTVDNREPLRMAAWFEHKLLMPPKDLTVSLNNKDVKLSGGEEVAKRLLAKRRNSFLQESILDAFRTTAYVQLKNIEMLDYWGLPAANGALPPDNNLMKSLIGKNIKIADKDKKKYKFEGPFMSSVSASDNQSVDTDINSSLRINFVARDMFMQMLANYQQVLASRLRLHVAVAMVASTPKLTGDDAGKGAVQKIYEEELELRKKMQESVE